MPYYQSNALYDYFKKNYTPHFKFVSGNLWQLIYGASNCSPKLLVLASGISNNKLDSKFSEDELEAFKTLEELSERTKIPLRFVRFIINEREVNEVFTFINNENGRIVSMDTLSQLFGQSGLPISQTPTGKYLNDVESSAYHKWQRACLGSSLKVSDLDLLRFSNENKITHLYELKRSYYSLENWEPFSVDYNNFRLVSRLMKKANIKFQIIYNVRKKNPWHDDISKLKIFDVDIDDDRFIIFNKYVSLQAFIDKP